MATTTDGGTLTSFSNTPQAKKACLAATHDHPLQDLTHNGAVIISMQEVAHG